MVCSSSGESKVYRPRRPRSSSDALSASFNGELLDSRQNCNSYDNLDATEESDGDDGPICVPALISPPRSAGEDVDLSPPDIGMATLDFDPMSFQCSLPDTSYTFHVDDAAAEAEACTIKRSPGSMCGKTGISDLISASFLGSLTSRLSSTDFSPSAGDNAGSKKMTTSYSYTDKPTQAVSPIKCAKANSLTPFPTSDLFTIDMPDKTPAGEALPPQPSSPSSPPTMGSVLLRVAEPSLSEAFQMELHSKLTAMDIVESREGSEQAAAACSREHQGKKLFTYYSPLLFKLIMSQTFPSFPLLKHLKTRLPHLQSSCIDPLCFCVPARTRGSGLRKGLSLSQIYSSHLSSSSPSST